MIRSASSQTLRLGLRSALARLRQAHSNVDARVTQGQRVRVALAAEAEHGDITPLDQGKVRVLVVEHLCWHVCRLLTKVGPESRYRIVRRPERPLAVRVGSCDQSLIGCRGRGRPVPTAPAHGCRTAGRARAARLVWPDCRWLQP